MRPHTRPENFNLMNVDRWGYLVGGIALAAIGLTRRGGVARMLTTALGASLFYQAYTGSNPLFRMLGIRVRQHERPGQTIETVEVYHSVTIQRPRREIWRFWRNQENLPRFMGHVEEVRQHGDRSHWRAKAPGGTSVEWDAVIVDEREDEMLRWESTAGSDIVNFGSVRFADAKDGGTEVSVRLEYVPPAGALSAAVARLTGEEPQRQLEDDLERLKELLESGEQVGSSSPRRYESGPLH